MLKLFFLQGRSTHNKSTLKNITLVTALATVLVVVPFAQTVNANRFESQIGELQQQNNQNLAKQKDLKNREQSISSVIADIQTNIASIQSRIANNRAKHNKLKESITKAEAEVAKQRKLLGINVRQLYLDDQMSTIEKLASSKNISDYIDKEQYRLSVQTKVNDTMERIDALKKKQESEKQAVEKLIFDQESMQKQLSAQQSENENLRNLNRQQQADYTSKVRANSAKITELQRQQAAENARHRLSGGGGSVTTNGGSYPWANNPFPNAIVDPWGMYTRQCVSYTAWKIASTGRRMPYWGGVGNANQWPGNASRAGIPVNGTPGVGSIAVSSAGYYGHVMYVEAVYGDGTIYVSDYNSNWDGRYAEYRRTTAGLVFIHF